MLLFGCPSARAEYGRARTGALWPPPITFSEHNPRVRPPMLSPLTLESPGEGSERRSSLLPSATSRRERREPRSRHSNDHGGGRSLPQTLLDYVLWVPYLFIGLTAALAGFLVSLVAIVCQWEPSPATEDAPDARYRRRPPRRRPPPILTTSPLSSPSASPPFDPTSTGTSTALRPRARRESARSNHSWRVELERVSEDEGELTATPSRELARRGTWGGPDVASELEPVPALVLDGGMSSETSSEVDTLPDAQTLEGRYKGLPGWGAAPPLEGSHSEPLQRRMYGERVVSAPPAFKVPSEVVAQSPVPFPTLAPTESAAAKRRRAFLRPFRARRTSSPTPSTPSPSHSPASSRSSSPYSTPVSSSTNLVNAVGSYFSSVPGDRRC